jgi:hypothetical protein
MSRPSTESMTWPENAMPPDATSGRLVSAPPPTPQRIALRLQAQKVLLQLEQSLQRSQEALLTLACAGLERETAEQWGLVLQFQDVVRRCAQSSAGRDSFGGEREAELNQEIRLCQSRVWMAARVQSALLSRAQAKLRTLAYMQAGPSAVYGPFPPPRRSTSGAPSARRI